MSNQETRKIAPYSGQRAPLRVNAFEALKGSVTPLLPLFPYVGPDAIIPTIAVHAPGPDRLVGRFWHQNSVTEVVTCVGSSGSEVLRPGTVLVNGATHPVGNAEDEPAGDGTTAITITQRHGTDEQRETFVLRCARCKHQLLAHEYSFTPENPEGDELEVFPTIVECSTGAELFNGDEGLRTCGKCGHVNAPFPLGTWGWRRYRSNAAAAETARAGLAAVAAPNGAPVASGPNGANGKAGA
jgi:hypothetical protein